MSKAPSLGFQLPYYFLGWKRKLSGGGPIFVTFFVTASCNAKCPHCLQAGKPAENAAELTPAEVDSIASRMAPFGNLLISGGEPFLREDLPEIIEPFYRRCRVRQITIPSNGTLPLRIEELSGRIARACPRAKVNIRLSLDGPPDLHDSIRGVPGIFELAMDSAGRIATLARSHPNLWLEFGTTLSTLNHGSYEALLAELDKRGVRQTPYIALCRPPTRVPGTWQVPVESYAAAQRAFRTRVLRDFTGRNPPVFLRVILAYLRLTENRIARVRLDPEYRWRCSAGKLSVVIGESGDVYPCETTWRKLGNLRDYGYDMTRILKDMPASVFWNEIRAGCRCTHETGITTDVSFSPRSLPEFAGRILRPKSQE